MKDLITIFSFCPTFEKKMILNELLSDLQTKRENFDIMVVSHSPISDLSIDMVDYFYYDKQNILLTDFEFTNKFWFRAENLNINSSLVYPYSTHLAIYRLIYYTINFSKFMNYKKTHFIEYDIKIDDYNLIDEVNLQLDNYDNVMFKGEDNWVWGTYFASNVQTLEVSDFIYDENKILGDLISSENRMTEYITPKILTSGDRSILYESITKIDVNKICQKVDEHFNDVIKWCVPVVSDNGDDLCFFVYNEKGWNSVIDVFVDNKHFRFKTSSKGVWNLNSIGKFSETTEVEIFVNKKLRNKIIFKDSNRENFRKNNFYRYF